MSSFPLAPSAPPGEDPKGLETMAQGGTQEDVAQMSSCAKGSGSRGMEEPALGAAVGLPAQLPTGWRVRLPGVVGSWPAEAFAQRWNVG